jgi:hypothetical protein
MLTGFPVTLRKRTSCSVNVRPCLGLSNARRDLRSRSARWGETEGIEGTSSVGGSVSTVLPLLTSVKVVSSGGLMSTE